MSAKAWWSDHRIRVANWLLVAVLVAVPVLVILHLPTLASLAALAVFAVAAFISEHVP